MQKFLEPYGVKHIYIDPSAAAFKEDLRRRNMRPSDANNDVDYGIRKMTNEMQQGNLLICTECKNLIREVQGYVWDSKKAKLGIDSPVKAHDHAIDAMRYAIATHKVSTFNEDEYYRKQQAEQRSRMNPGGYGGW